MSMDAGGSKPQFEALEPRQLLSADVTPIEPLPYDPPDVSPFFITLPGPVFPPAPAPQLTAEAGPDMVVRDWLGDGYRSVSLNGVYSHRGAAAITDYIWMEGKNVLADAAKPSLDLSVGVHTLKLVVLDKSGGQASDTVTVEVLPTLRNQDVSVSADADTVIEGNYATFTLTRTGAVNHSLTVHFKLAGTAKAGVDYRAPSSWSVTFGIGQRTATFSVRTIQDTQTEGLETLSLAVQDGSGHFADRIAGSAETKIKDCLQDGQEFTTTGTIRLEEFGLIFADNATALDATNAFMPPGPQYVVETEYGTFECDSIPKEFQRPGLKVQLKARYDDGWLDGMSIRLHGWSIQLIDMSVAQGPQNDVTPHILLAGETLTGTGKIVYDFKTKLWGLLTPDCSYELVGLPAEFQKMGLWVSFQASPYRNSEFSTWYLANVLSFSEPWGQRVSLAEISRFNGQPPALPAVVPHATQQDITSNGWNIVDPIRGPSLLMCPSAGDDRLFCDYDGDGRRDVSLYGGQDVSRFGEYKYVWTEGGQVLATGRRPVVSLTVGVHYIHLTFISSSGQTSSDDVRVSVVPLLSATSPKKSFKVGQLFVDNATISWGHLGRGDAITAASTLYTLSQTYGKLESHGIPLNLNTAALTGKVHVAFVAKCVGIRADGTPKVDILQIARDSELPTPYSGFPYSLEEHPLATSYMKRGDTISRQGLIVAGDSSTLFTDYGIFSVAHLPQDILTQALAGKVYVSYSGKCIGAGTDEFPQLTLTSIQVDPFGQIQPFTGDGNVIF